MFKTRLVVFCLAAAAALCPAAGYARSSSVFKGTGTLERVVKEVARRQKSITSIQATFKQEKVLGLLAQPEVSSGTFFYAKPDRVLWNYTAPRPVVIAIAKGRLTTWYPLLNKAETLEVSRYQDKIFKYMGATSALDDLANYFNFTFTDRAGSPYRLDLKPINRIVARRVRGITIWIDRETFVTSKFEYTEKDGDVTRYEFNDIKLNAPIPAEKFTLQLPPNTRVEQLKTD
ncbi:MAG TPA: outer membrane lipoprotein carrier protein LolA [Thermoanaerobaculia bacterium]|nr:outer membrane lipoprotein carrier protein LolA [Thermoanaerobaculia bacterium]